MRFTALLYHIYNRETLRMAYFALKKEAAPGVDRETWRHYGEQLERFNLELHPQKTQLLEFGPFAINNRQRRGEGGRRRSTSNGLIT